MAFSVRKSAAVAAIAVGLVFSASAPALAADETPKAACDSAFKESLAEARAEFEGMRTAITEDFKEAKDAVEAEAGAARADAREDLQSAKDAYRAVYAAFKENPTTEGAAELEQARQALKDAQASFQEQVRAINEAKRFEIRDLISLRTAAMTDAKDDLRSAVDTAREVRAQCKRGA